MGKTIPQLDDYSPPLTGNELIELSGGVKISLDALFSAPLWGDRIIDLNGHELSFTTNGWEVAISPGEGYALLVNDGVQDLLLVDPINHAVILRANNTPDTSLAQLLFGADSAGDGVYFNLGLNAGSGETKITGDAIAKTIILTADNGTIITPPIADPHVVGVLWNNAGTPAISAG